MRFRYEYHLRGRPFDLLTNLLVEEAWRMEIITTNNTKLSTNEGLVGRCLHLSLYLTILRLVAFLSSSVCRGKALLHRGYSAARVNKISWQYALQ